MKRISLRRGLLLAGIVGTIGGTTFPAPAQANHPPPGVNIIAAGGSDTTEFFMEGYLRGRTFSTDNGVQYPVVTRNIPALQAPGASFVVEGDVDCPNGTITYSGANSSTAPGTQYTSTSATTYLTPNGSTGGRRFLYDQRIAAPDAACLDIARSSSTPGVAGESSSAQYYAFAIDAVTWATQSQYAPATLTLAQIQGIYNCTFTNWNQVGGSDMAIQRLLPQEGSGTRAFFVSAFGLGTPPSNVAGCPNVVDTVPDGPDAGTDPDPLQESDGSVIPPQFRDTGIIGYSAGRWVQQANNRGNPTIDVRNDVRLGGYTTGLGVRGLPVEFLPGDRRFQLDTISDPGRPAVVTEANISLATPTFNGTNDYRGIRYLFNVIDENSPSYLPSRGLIGFNNVPGGSTSPLCSPTDPAGRQLGTFGFARLNTTSPPALGGTTNLAGSSCRRFLGTG